MGLFDGMTGILDDVFGGPVTVTPPGGAARVEQAVFREAPLVVLDGDMAAITTVKATLSGDARALGDLVPDGIVEPGNGQVYRCMSRLPSGSPATDARLVIDLERQ